jgi:hypothetical protein
MKKSTGIERFRKKIQSSAEVVGLNGAEHIESIVLNENEAKEQFLQTILFLFWSYAKARTNWKGVRN